MYQIDTYICKPNYALTIDKNYMTLIAAFCFSNPD